MLVGLRGGAGGRSGSRCPVGDLHHHLVAHLVGSPVCRLDSWSEQDDGSPPHGLYPSRINEEVGEAPAQLIRTCRKESRALVLTTVIFVPVFGTSIPDHPSASGCSPRATYQSLVSSKVATAGRPP